MKAYSIFNSTGKMQEIKPIPTLPIGCKIYAYGYGMEGTEGAIISEADSNGTYKGVYISTYKSGFFTVDKYSRSHSQVFGIGHYFDDNFETVADNILEEYILKAEIASKLKSEQAEAKANADAKEIIELPTLYPHLVGNETGEQNTTKKNIIAELKKHFSNFKFSVRKDYYSSYTVAWINGPTEEEVDNVISKFVSYENDFTGDFRDPNPSNFNRVFGGLKYLSTSRSYSDNILGLFTDFKVLDDTDRSGYYDEAENVFYKILRKTSFAPGAKPIKIQSKKDFTGSYEDSFEFFYSQCVSPSSSSTATLKTVTLNLDLVDYSEDTEMANENISYNKLILNQI